MTGIIHISQDDYRALAKRIRESNGISYESESSSEEKTVEYDRGDITVILSCTFHTRTRENSASTDRGVQRWKESEEQITDIAIVAIDYRPQYPVEDAPTDFDPQELKKHFN